MRDPAFDPAWRKHSPEMPPADVDQAILAAAHRAVGSAPAAIGGASSTRPSRWWMPVMAAAAIGAVAIGVLQLSTPDREMTSAVVTDMPAATREFAMAKPPAPAEPGQERKPQADASPPAPAASATAPAPAGRDAAPHPPANAPRVAQRPAPVQPVERSDRALEKRSADTVAPRPQPQPFPEQKQERNAAAGAAAPPAAPPPSSADAAVARQRAENESDRAQPDARAPAQPAPAPAAPASGRLLDESRAHRDPVEWIARLRALRAAGDNDTAARELKAFRATYDDADTRLPEDLRSWAASIPR